MTVLFIIRFTTYLEQKYIIKKQNHFKEKIYINENNGINVYFRYFKIKIFVQVANVIFCSVNKTYVIKPCTYVE